MGHLFLPTNWFALKDLGINYGLEIIKPIARDLYKCETIKKSRLKITNFRMREVRTPN